MAGVAGRGSALERKSLSWRLHRATRAGVQLRAWRTRRCEERAARGAPSATSSGNRPRSPSPREDRRASRIRSGEAGRPSPSKSLAGPRDSARRGYGPDGAGRTGSRAAPVYSSGVRTSRSTSVGSPSRLASSCRRRQVPADPARIRLQPPAPARARPLLPRARRPTPAMPPASRIATCGCPASSAAICAAGMAPTPSPRSTRTSRSRPVMPWRRSRSAISRAKRARRTPRPPRAAGEPRTSGREPRDVPAHVCVRGHADVADDAGRPRRGAPRASPSRRRSSKRGDDPRFGRNRRPLLEPLGASR